MSGHFQKRPRVKICGVTNREDAETAIALGADALGFNLFPQSKRYIDLDQEATWIEKLPPFISRVAVLVNLPLEEARRISAHSAIDLLQLHGDEDEEYCAAVAEFGRPFIKALRIKDAAEIGRGADFYTPHVLLDAHVPGEFGGTGAVVNLELAAEFVRQHERLQIILAGGLTPENVGAAVARVRPFAVDVASGVEAEPRRKDAARVAAFISAACQSIGQ
ncbi:MAG TPA: phosphoribosylanthranilate isomerase [Chthoniobacteraceae bacterium]|jgi:phosphoribosylanthranilate isomerase